jgi:hypothetical protein
MFVTKADSPISEDLYQRIWRELCLTGFSGRCEDIRRVAEVTADALAGKTPASDYVDRQCHRARARTASATTHEGEWR